MTWKQRSKNRRQRRELIQAKEDRKALATRRVINLGTAEAEAGPMHPLIRQAQALVNTAQTEAQHQHAARELARAKTIAHRDILRSLRLPTAMTYPKRAPRHHNPWGSTVKPPWIE